MATKRGEGSGRTWDIGTDTHIIDTTYRIDN